VVTIIEERPADSEHDRVCEQPEFVEQVSPCQLSVEVRAADADVSVRLLAQHSDLLDLVIPEP
jgi:hypothetical protein